MGSVIIGSGRALPARIVTNDELSEIVDTTDEWIVPRTGIHTRHVAIEETCTDLGAQAALRALGLEEGGWQREAEAIEAASLDMIICPTLTADTHFPSEAARIRERIGATNAVCYDMSCACSGCVYGLSTADLIMAGAAFARQEAARTGTPLRCNDVRRVLVVAAERLSKLVDWEERATCILFGDGAGAVVLEWRDEAETSAAGADGAAGAAGADAPGATAPSPPARCPSPPTARPPPVLLPPPPRVLPPPMRKATPICAWPARRCSSSPPPP